MAQQKLLKNFKKLRQNLDDKKGYIIEIGEDHDMHIKNIKAL